MSTTTLYGQLTSAAAREFELKNDVYRAHSAQINRFGEAIKDLDIEPHAYARLDKTLGLSAKARRGQNHVELLDKLKAAGFTISDPLKTPNQFTDGYVMWTVRAQRDKVDFTLLYYVEVEAI